MALDPKNCRVIAGGDTARCAPGCRPDRTFFVATEARITLPANRLTAKQKRFISEYLLDLNATQAAIRAEYSAKLLTGSP